MKLRLVFIGLFIIITFRAEQRTNSALGIPMLVLTFASLIVVSSLCLILSVFLPIKHTNISLLTGIAISGGLVLLFGGCGPYLHLLVRKLPKWLKQSPLPTTHSLTDRCLLWIGLCGTLLADFVLIFRYPSYPPQIVFITLVDILHASLHTIFVELALERKWPPANEISTLSVLLIVNNFAGLAIVFYRTFILHTVIVETQTAYNRLFIQLSSIITEAPSFILKMHAILFFSEFLRNRSP